MNENENPRAVRFRWDLDKTVTEELAAVRSAVMGVENACSVFYTNDTELEESAGELLIAASELEHAASRLHEKAQKVLREAEARLDEADDA